MASVCAAAPPSCAPLGGTVDAGQLCHVQATGPNYTIKMTFPADYPDEQALTDYIAQNRDGFVNVAQSSGGRDQPFQFEATTEQRFAGQPPHNTRSVVLKFFQDLGGSHPSNWFKTFITQSGESLIRPSLVLVAVPLNPILPRIVSIFS